MRESSKRVVVALERAHVDIQSAPLVQKHPVNARDHATHHVTIVAELVQVSARARRRSCRKRLHAWRVDVPLGGDDGLARASGTMERLAIADRILQRSERRKIFFDSVGVTCFVALVPHRKDVDVVVLQLIQ